MSYLSKQGRRVWRSKKSRKNTLAHRRAVAKRSLARHMAEFALIYTRPNTLLNYLLRYT